MALWSRKRRFDTQFWRYALISYVGGYSYIAQQVCAMLSGVAQHHITAATSPLQYLILSIVTPYRPVTFSAALLITLTGSFR
jgi:hypothetical protein